MPQIPLVKRNPISAPHDARCHDKIYKQFLIMILNPDSKRNSRKNSSASQKILTLNQVSQERPLIWIRVLLWRSRQWLWIIHKNVRVFSKVVTRQCCWEVLTVIRWITEVDSLLNSKIEFSILQSSTRKGTKKKADLQKLIFGPLVN